MGNDESKLPIPTQPVVVHRNPDESDEEGSSNEPVSYTTASIPREDGIVTVSHGETSSNHIDPDLSTITSLPKFTPLISSSADIPFAWKELFASSEQTGLDSFDPAPAIGLAATMQDRFRHDTSDIALKQRAIIMKMRQIEQTNQQNAQILASSIMEVKGFGDEQKTLSKINNELGMVIGLMERSFDLIDDIQYCLGDERLEQFKDVE